MAILKVFFYLNSLRNNKRAIKMCMIFLVKMAVFIVLGRVIIATFIIIKPCQIGALSMLFSNCWTKILYFISKVSFFCCYLTH